LKVPRNQLALVGDVASTAHLDPFTRLQRERRDDADRVEGFALLSLARAFFLALACLTRLLL
jgi:hypothetical protein